MRRPIALLAWLLAGSCGSSPLSSVGDCFGQSSLEKQRCLDDFYAAHGEGKTTAELLKELEEGRSDGAIEQHCHEISHAIGRWTYKQLQDVGQAFGACDGTCHSGCYHGVVERLLYSDADLATGEKHVSLEELEQKLPHICSEETVPGISGPVFFQCLHGLGHAVLFALRYDLPAALGACDFLRSDFERSSCYGGVFMENVTAAEEDKRRFDADDPLYPCNSVEPRYAPSCYLMQTSVMKNIGLDDEEVAQACRGAGDFQGACFISFGRDMSNGVRGGDPGVASEACEELSSGFTSECLYGLVYALVDNTWNGRFAYPACAALQAEDNRRVCFRHANGYLRSSFGLSPETIAEHCRSWAGPSAELCAATLPGG